MNKQKFVELLLRSGALAFGEFKTKSGRISPYFFNTGCFSSALLLSELAGYYASLIEQTSSFKQVNNLFGPSYKGIPLAIATTQALAYKISRDISFTFNRKEVKDHGEQGLLVGYDYRKTSSNVNVIVIEDVLTGGTSLRETFSFLKPYNINILGIVLGIDREERSGNDASISARKEIETLYKTKIHALISLSKIVSILHNKEVLGKIWIDDMNFKRIEDYRNTYG